MFEHSEKITNVVNELIISAESSERNVVVMCELAAVKTKTLHRTRRVFIYIKKRTLFIATTVTSCCDGVCAALS